MPAVLFVCLGNICRSPCAEGVLRHQIKNQAVELNIHVESCGLGDWHEGQLPDSRMRETAKNRGVILASRAQPFRQDFFDHFDYIFAADESVLHQLQQWAVEPHHKAKVHLMTQYSETHFGKEVPDPFYHGQDQFELVMDMVEDLCRGIVHHLKSVE